MLIRTSGGEEKGKGKGKGYQPRVVNCTDNDNKERYLIDPIQVRSGVVKWCVFVWEKQFNLPDGDYGEGDREADREGEREGCGW